MDSKEAKNRIERPYIMDQRFGHLYEALASMERAITIAAETTPAKETLTPPMQVEVKPIEVALNDQPIDIEPQTHNVNLASGTDNPSGLDIDAIRAGIDNEFTEETPAPAMQVETTLTNQAIDGEYTLAT